MSALLAPIGLLLGGVTSLFLFAIGFEIVTSIAMFFFVLYQPALATKSLLGVLIAQYTPNADLYLPDIVHRSMFRIFAYMLGAFQFLAFIPTFVMVVLGTIFIAVEITKRK